MKTLSTFENNSERWMSSFSRIKKYIMYILVFILSSYDVVFTSGEEEILRKFKEANARVVISAEDFVWPDKSLKVRFKIFSFNITCTCPFTVEIIIPVYVISRTLLDRG